MPAQAPPQTLTKPVEDSVPKVEDEVAVGEDLDFQRRWWKFEHIIWSFFVLVLICDLLGLFGRGWLAKAKQSTPDQALTLEYERIARASTPSRMILRFGPSAIHDGHIQLFVSDSVVKDLGAQRIAPQPAISALADGGFAYTFPATGSPTEVEFGLMPEIPGSHKFRVQVLGDPASNETIEASVFVVP